TELVVLGTNPAISEVRNFFLRPAP
ncbi:MAG: hypothetical protein QOD41_2379, partial [Cryptosporangiaceae bacterium]|nr:hypothetical protein [Cryptosporangiaceae bacterium]